MIIDLYSFHNRHYVMIIRDDYVSLRNTVSINYATRSSGAGRVVNRAESAPDLVDSRPCIYLLNPGDLVHPYIPIPK